MTKTIIEVIDELKAKSRIGGQGMEGPEVVVEKELLRIASVYLEDYMLLLESLQEESDG